MKKCPCGRPIATEEECKEAHEAERCEGCYRIEQYARIVKKKNPPVLPSHDQQQSIDERNHADDGF